MKRLIFTLFIFLIMPILQINAASPAVVTLPSITPIKILLVPGHDDAVWGAQYGNLKEADMNLTLATQIFNILKKDKRFDVHITRDSKGYTKEFSDFLIQKDAILAFEQNARKILQSKITSGSFVVKDNTPHHQVSEDIALRLYGFNKWADENKMDAVIHVHFNDYPRPNKWTIGQYRGFAIYVPESQFANSKDSTSLATSIFTQLHKKYTISNWKPEAAGITPDQKLIAIGSNNTLGASVRSVLVEYGYIYRFGNSVVRHQAYKDMSALTVQGIKNYFFPKIK